MMVRQRTSSPCVRCGRRPQSRRTYLCDVCLADPRAVQEVRTVEASSEGYLAQRRLCVERFGWVGGWSGGRRVTS
jgi:hypothetical protein